MPPLPHESALQYLARIGRLLGKHEPSEMLKTEIQRGKRHPIGLFMVDWKY